MTGLELLYGDMSATRDALHSAIEFYILHGRDVSAIFPGLGLVRADRRLRTDEKAIRAQSTIPYKGNPKP
jgi:hypothetical protein